MICQQSEVIFVAVTIFAGGDFVNVKAVLVSFADDFCCFQVLFFLVAFFLQFLLLLLLFLVLLVCDFPQLR